MEWDEQEQAHMLALGQWRSVRCPGCGGHLPDTTEAEAEDGYVTDLPQQCHRCVALSIAHGAYAEEPHPNSLLFVAKRR